MGNEYDAHIDFLVSFALLASEVVPDDLKMAVVEAVDD